MRALFSIFIHSVRADLLQSQDVTVAGGGVPLVRYSTTYIEVVRQAYPTLRPMVIVPQPESISEDKLDVFFSLMHKSKALAAAMETSSSPSGPPC